MDICKSEDVNRAYTVENNYIVENSNNYSKQIATSNYE
jgi:hypothetical protein